MTTKRTDEEKLVQAPVVVILGGQEHSIKPLPIKYSLPWVNKAASEIVGVVGLVGVTSEDSGAFEKALTEIISTKPARMVDLFFEYARDLDRSQIEEVATSFEIAKAFEEVVSLERPLFGMTFKVLTGAIPEGAEEALSLLATSGQSSRSSSASGTSPRPR